MSVKHTATHPITIIVAVILGIVTGIYWPQASPLLTPIANSYLALLAMALLPIIFSVILLGIARCFHNVQALRLIGYFIIITIIISVITAIIGMTIMTITEPNLRLHPHTEYILGKLTEAVSYYPAKQNGATNSINFANFLREITPQNIFSTLSEGITLKLVALAVLLGIALGRVSDTYGKPLLNLITSINRLFDHIFHWLMALLPIGLFCLFASKVTEIDFAILVSLIKFVLLFYIVSLGMLTVFNTCLMLILKQPFSKTLTAFKKSLTLAFFVDSSYITIPETLRVFSNYDLDTTITNVTFPLGVIMIRFGRVLLLAMLMVYSAHFYAIPMTIPTSLFILTIVTFIAPIIPGRLLLIAPLFATLASMIGMSPTLGALIVVIIDPFANRLECTLTVFGNCVTTALTAKRGNICDISKSA